jgi:chitinase
MKKSTILTLGSLVGGLIANQIAAETNGNHIVTAYYPNWATYAKNFQPDDIQPNNLDVINYAFAQVGDCALPYATDSTPDLCNKNTQFSGNQDYKLHSTDPWSDFYDNGGKGNIFKVLDLGKPVILSIGGYSASVPLFTAMDDQHRAGFVQSVADFLDVVKNKSPDQKTFSGIDIDWEPNDNAWTFVEKEDGKARLGNYLKLMKELRQALPKKALSVAFPASPMVIYKVHSVDPDFWKSLSSSVDTINLMAYDYHGAWDNPPLTNFNAPLYFDPHQPDQIPQDLRENFNIQATVTAYKDVGVETSKILLGVPLYARSYALKEKSSNGLYESFTGSSPTPSGDGTLLYSDIIANSANWNTRQNYDAGQAVAIGHSGTSFITYDNTVSTVNKAKFITSKSLGGIMFWDVSGDVKKDSSQYEELSPIHAAASFFNSPSTQTSLEQEQNSVKTVKNEL